QLRSLAARREPICVPSRQLSRANFSTPTARRRRSRARAALALSTNWLSAPKRARKRLRARVMMQGVQIVASAKQLDTRSRATRRTRGDRRARATLRGALAGLVDAQAAQLLDQALTRDAEDARGSALVARGEAQHLVDVVHLDLRERRQREHVAHRGGRRRP